MKDEASGKAPYVFEEVIWEVQGRVLTLTLNRPHRKNALTPTLVNELIVALEEADRRPKIGAVILRGAGGAFCSGADLKEMQKGSRASSTGVPARGGFVELNLMLHRMGKPTIACIEGLAMAGGLGLAAGCTFAMAEANAQFSTPEINRGIFPMMIMANIFRLVPKRLGLEWILLGSRFTAAEALSAGLLNRVVHQEDLESSLATFASELANKPPNTMRLGLRAFRKQAEMDYGEALPWLESALQECISTPDAMEGIMAFIQKREPDWSQVPLSASSPDED